MNKNNRKILKETKDKFIVYLVNVVVISIVSPIVIIYLFNNNYFNNLTLARTITFIIIETAFVLSIMISFTMIMAGRFRRIYKLNDAELREIFYFYFNRNPIFGSIFKGILSKYLFEQSKTAASVCRQKQNSGLILALNEIWNFLYLQNQTSM